MASNESSPQLAILKRSKRQVAVQIKSECCRVSNNGVSCGTEPQQLEEILKFLLDPEKSFDIEAADWCKSIIAGGIDFKDYAENVRQFDNAKVCGLVWTAKFIAYRCRTCGISPCMSLCPDCFYGADHTGHDFNMFRSHAGGACDCGDPNVMKPSGFCTKHGQQESAPKAIPAEVTATAKHVIPRLITRFIYYLRTKHQEWLTSGGLTDPVATDTGVVFNLDDGEHLLSLLHELTSLGAVFRTMISQAVVDTERYSREFIFNNSHEESVLNLSPYKVLCHEQYVQAKLGLPPPKPEFFRVKVCKNLRELSHQRCNYQCVQKALSGDGDLPELDHQCALGEILFWTVKYHFPEKITTWLLALLPDDSFKDKFTKMFVEHYSRISTSLVHCKGNEQRQRVSNKVVHVSVQLFSNEGYAIRMTSEHQLLTRMIISLYNMLTQHLIPSSMAAVKSAHMILDCSSDIIKDHCFWPLISDLVNIMSHKQVALMFMDSPILLDVWFEMISFLQCMNLNERELVQHVEYETDTYYASFSAEFEISCSPLWRLLVHCTDSSTNRHLGTIIRKCMEALNVWFGCVGTSSSAGIKVNEYQVSFHLPLHRYFAAFLCSAVLQDAFNPEAELSQEFLKNLMLHPLQIQVAFYEIFAQMWVRNGLQIRGQAMTYTQCHFCNSLVDLDFFLLQVCASYLNADYFVQTTLKLFHLEHWNTLVDTPIARDNIELSQDDAMLEGCLSMLAMILCIRTYSGQSTESILYNEIITLLCMADRTYSQLCDSVPEKSGSYGGPTDIKQYLQKVADFKAPGFNVNGKLQQGTYCPKPEVWLNDYDPLHAMLRTVHRREFQQSMDRYTEFVQNVKSFPQGQTPWPPFRIPSEPLKAYSGIYNLLRSKTLLDLCFNILHKKLNKKTHTVTEPSLYLTMFLLQLMLHENDSDSKMVQTASSHNLFPHELTLDNFLHVVGTITLQVPLSKLEKEMLDSDQMDTEEGGTDEDIQNMFSRQSHHDSQSGVAVTTSIPRFRERGSTPGTISSPAPVIPLLGSSSSSLVKQVEVTVNESVVSLLMKLHNRLSDQSGSYVPLTLRGGMVDSSGLVGDGPFFVGRVLDTLSTKSSKCASVVESVYNDLLPKNSSDSHSVSARKKKKAMERQKKILEKMNKMQNKFMDNIEKTLSKEEFEKLTEDDPAESNYVVIEHYECSICSSTTPSTIERPMGMVSLMQSTCVLNFARSIPQPDRLPMEQDGAAGVEMFASHFSKVNNKLDTLFKDKHHNVSAHGMDRATGVFIQSCGHYLHLDCFQAYQESVTSQTRNRQSLSSDEFHCPLCRQLANSLLPVLPAGSQSPVMAVPPADPVLCVKDIAAMLLQKPAKWPSSIYYRELSAVVSRLRSNVVHERRKSLHADNHYDMANFLFSTARCNLDYMQLYETNNIVVSSRKPSIVHLLSTLSQHIGRYEGQSTEALDILSQLTGLDLEPVPSTSVVLHQGVIPLLLRDPITVFIQLYLNLPPQLSAGYLERIISAVYNLTYVQALLHVSCKFNEDERQSWISRYSAESHSASAHHGRSSQSAHAAYKHLSSSSSGTRAEGRTSHPEMSSRQASLSSTFSRKSCVEGGTRSSPHTSGHLLHTIIKQLTTIGFYPSNDSTTSFLECSVWSPQSVESFLQNSCLPFLEFAATLRQHVYNSPLPARPDIPQSAPDGSSCSPSADPVNQDCQKWFRTLCTYLGLIKEDTASDSPSEQALNWLDQNPHSIVKGWLNFVMTCKNRPVVMELLTSPVKWYMPRLLELPTQYDTIFQHYRNMTCPQCSQPPVAPSICLICGSFVCFKEVCCLAHSGVTHSKQCGSGTSVILDINASIVAIIRGKRATLWGSVYLDEHGEEDRDLKRGKPLYLCRERYMMLEQQWLSHNFDYVCKRWIFHSDQL